jgi:UDP-N-acetylmuramate--alanine ligase
LIVNDIYPASEEPIAGIHSAALCEAIRQTGHKHVEYIPDAEATVDYLLKTIREKDTVATIGAGSIYKIGEAFIKQLVAREKKKG